MRRAKASGLPRLAIKLPPVHRAFRNTCRFRQNARHGGCCPDAASAPWIRRCLGSTACASVNLSILEWHHYATVGCHGEPERGACQSDSVQACTKSGWHVLRRFSVTPAHPQVTSLSHELPAWTAQAGNRAVEFATGRWHRTTSFVELPRSTSRQSGTGSGWWHRSR